MKPWLEVQFKAEGRGKLTTVLNYEGIQPRPKACNPSVSIQPNQPSEGPAVRYRRPPFPLALNNHSMFPTSHPHTHLHSSRHCPLQANHQQTSSLSLPSIPPEEPSYPMTPLPCSQLPFFLRFVVCHESKAPHSTHHTAGSHIWIFIESSSHAHLQFSFDSILM